MELDRTDFDILQLLAKDARLSNKEIAAAIGLAPSSCHERLKALREEGVLLGSHAEVDFGSIGLSLEALLFVHVAVRDMERLKNLISEHFNLHPCVIRVETSVIFNREVQH